VSELGQVLQRAREEKGITLDDIQRITKIQRRYLEAIERGHFHVLPGHFYARAFIKSYAEAVGLDPNHILSHFQSDLPAQPPQEQLERLRRRRAVAANSPLQSGRWVSKTLLVLFIALIIGVIYIAVVNSNGVQTQPIPGNNAADVPQVVDQSPGTVTPATPLPATPPTGTTTPGSTIPPTGATVPTEPIAEQTPVLTLESQKGSQYTYALSGGEKITVKLKATNDRCWFGVAEARGKKYINEGTLEKGQEKVVELGQTAYVRLGKPSAVELTFNGAPVDTSKLKRSANFEVKIQPTTGQ
jgi:cytoskeletal protein RodZ